jgi:3-phosphoshikimate 1-carboxyvinyltransferase
VAGDISSSAFFIVAALITHDSELTIRNVGMNPGRTGIIEALVKMGGDISAENVREVSGEPVADLVVRSSELSGIEISGPIIPRMIDEIPVFCVARAATGRQPCAMRGASPSWNRIESRRPDNLRALGERRRTGRTGIIEGTGDHRGQCRLVRRSPGGHVCGGGGPGVPRG